MIGNISAGAGTAVLAGLFAGAAAADGMVYSRFPVTVKGYQGEKTSSVSYTGQIARHALHDSLKKLAGPGFRRPGPAFFRDRPVMESFVVDFVDRLADRLLDPRQRVFLGYLASALALALAFHWIAAGGEPRNALPRLFSPRVWRSRSARADYRIAALNRAATMGVAPDLLSKLATASPMSTSPPSGTPPRSCTNRSFGGSTR